ncbi:MAG TPA: hypothetical protein VK772_10715, partial [Puia sp.]|nr:hypothetical protein [Puia sp.]
MKIIKWFFVSLLCFHVCQAQNVFYDAKRLEPFAKNTDGFVTINVTDDNINAIDSVLSNYIDTNSLKKDTTKELLIHDIEVIFKDNLFLRFAFNIKRKSFLTTSVEFKQSVAPGGIGGLDVSNIADGIAQFLIKRGKEELSIAFFSRLKTFLDNPSNPEFKTLLPATTAFLENINSYQYSELIQSIRVAFQTDLSNLIVNLNQLINLPKFQALLAQLPEIRVAIRSALVISELSQSSGNLPMDPSMVIHQLSALKEWKEINQNLAGSWELLDVISQSVLFQNANLPNNDPNRHIWVTLSDFNDLISNPVGLKLFLGMLFQKSAGIKFMIGSTEMSVQTYFINNASNISAISSIVENFVLLANDVDRMISDIQAAKGKPTNDQLYTYISKAVNITEYGFKIANQIQPGIADDHYIIMARNANDMYKNIYSKQYSAAVMNLYLILNQIFNQRSDLADQKIMQLKSKKVTDSVKISAINSAINSPGLPDAATLAAVLKYTNFIAAVVKAQSADDVESALEAAALPAGSYSIKQNSTCNISLNGYIGYAWDFNHGSGVYAPIGFSFSTKISK